MKRLETDGGERFRTFKCVDKIPLSPDIDCCCKNTPAEKKSLFVTVVVPWREGGGMLKSCLETKVAQIAPPSGGGAFFMF